MRDGALAIQVERRIYLIRGQKVMLDFELAELYRVETRALKQAVRRNADRFPGDFMFKLNANEMGSLVSQNVIPSRGKFGGARPMAFTEQGVAMLSSVLRSPRAVQVNIAIMRTFVVYGRCFYPTPSLPANSTLSRKNTMPNSRSFSMPSAN
jgi:hypothetical protein